MTVLAAEDVVEKCDVTKLGDADLALLARLHQVLSKERVHTTYAEARGLTM